MLGDIHAISFWASAAAVAGLIVVAAAIRLGAPGGRIGPVRVDRRLADRFVLAIVAATGIAALSGLALVVTGHRPADGLHIVYGVAAVVGLPIGRYLVRRDGPQRMALGLAMAGILVAGVLARLAMTGG